MKFLVAAFLTILLTLPLLAQTNETTTEVPGRVTIEVPSQTVRPRLRPIDVTYVAETSTEARAANRGDNSRFKAEQHIGIGFSLSDTRKIQFRQYFLYNMSDYRKDNEWDLGDHAIQYTDSRAFIIGNDPGSFMARFYLPGSDYSRRVGKYELRLNGEYEQFLRNRFSLAYILNTRFYAHSDRADGQPAFRVFPALYLNYNLNPHFTPFIGAYTEHTWRHTGVNVTTDLRPQERGSVSVNYDALYHSVGIRTQPFKNVRVSLYTETEDSLRDGERINWFDENFTVYYMDVSVSL